MLTHFFPKKIHSFKINQVIENTKQSLVLTIIFSILFILIKFYGSNIKDTLWAEDGTIFLKESYAHGLQSLITPYAGYLHFYPRIVAFFSSFFEIQYTPIIFFCGWLIAYFGFVYTAFYKIKYLGVGSLHIPFITLLLVAQPHSGEVFFNLTNVQWFTGAALAIYLLIPNQLKTPSLTEIGFITLLSLTGPFSILLLPIAAIQLFVLRDWNQRKSIYFTLMMCAAIQALCIIFSKRFSHEPVDMNVIHWLRAVYTFLIFGKKPLIPQLAAIVFWGMTFYSLSVMTLKIREDIDSTSLIALNCLFAGFIFLVSSLLHTDPKIISPLGNAARYFFIPYILFFISALIINSKIKHGLKISFITLSIVSVATFSKQNIPNLQFEAFTVFSRTKNDVSVPIRPELTWNIHLPFKEKITTKLKPISLSILEINSHLQDNQANIQSKENESALSSYYLLDIGKRCLSSEFIGLVIHLSLPSDSITSISWDKPGEFKKSYTLNRNYSAGNIAAEYAFPVNKNQLKYVSFKAINNTNVYRLDSAQLYCL